MAEPKKTATRPRTVDRRAAEKMEKAMVRIILTQPFFAMLLVRLVKDEDRTATSIWTDGKQIGYNPDFVNSNKLEAVSYSLFASTYHVVLKHNTRRGKRDETIWNQACDHVVAWKLDEAGFTPPADYPQLDPDFKDLSAEEAYLKLLPPPPPPQPPQPPTQPPPPGGEPGEGEGEGEGEGQDEGQDGDDEGQDEGQEGEGQDGDITDGVPGGDPGEGGSEIRDLPTEDPAEIAEEEASWEVAVNQAAQISRAAGKLPAGMDRILEALKEPVVDWKKELIEFLMKNSKDDYSWKRPNRRHVANNVYLPSMLSDGNLDQAVIGVDTSGSINSEDLALFGGEMTSILESLKAEKITVVYCDHGIGNVQEFGQQDLPLDLKPSGGGGTSFAPVMDYVFTMDEQPACLIYFTDGYCSDFGTRPDIPVLWIITSNGDHHFKPPFGRVVQMESKAYR